MGDDITLKYVVIYYQDPSTGSAAYLHKSPAGDFVGVSKLKGAVLFNRLEAQKVINAAAGFPHQLCIQAVK